MSLEVISYNNRSIIGGGGTGTTGFLTAALPLLINTTSQEISLEIDETLLIKDGKLSVVNTIPSLTNNKGKVLYTDGIVMYWGSVDAPNSYTKKEVDEFFEGLTPIVGYNNTFWDQAYIHSMLTEGNIHGILVDDIAYKSRDNLFTGINTFKGELDTQAIDFTQTIVDPLADPIVYVIPDYKEGRVFYDKTKESLTVFNDNSELKQALGRDTYKRVINLSGQTIVRGTVVYINGVFGDIPTIALASSIVSPDAIIGITLSTIGGGNEGDVMVGGDFLDIPLEFFIPGAPIYISNEIPGGITPIKPSGNNFPFIIGIAQVCTTNGSMFVSPHLAPLTGNVVTHQHSNYIQNQNISAQTANQWISGTGKFDTAVSTPQFQSTIALGTAPLTIVSSTLVSNLNADLLDGYHASEFILASTNPLTGTGTAKYLSVWDTSGTSLTNSIIYHDGENTAIGTTSPLAPVHIRYPSLLQVISNISTGNTGSLQTWTVPTTGVYTITAKGASGGNANPTYHMTIAGKGATVIGDYDLTAGDVITFLVGQQGSNSTATDIYYQSGGGGGGTMVKRGSTVIHVAGGGGGGSWYNSVTKNGQDASITTSGGTGGVAGGTGGTGGGASTSDNPIGSSGAGITSNSGAVYSGTIAYALTGTGTGGTATGGSGGYGGGGAGGFSGAGAGGGYSGGGGGSSSVSAGGGGSYTTGTNQVFTAAGNSGHGMVSVSFKSDGVVLYVENCTSIGFMPSSTEALNNKLAVNGTTLTYNLKITNSAVNGYVWKCTNTDGSGSWSPITASQVYKDTWNASTNTPTLANGTGTAGWYYIVSTAGTNLGYTFAVGDTVIYNGSTWDRVPVAGYTLPTSTASILGGIKVGTGLSIDGSGILSVTSSTYTDTNARAAISLTTTGTSGAATYNSSTGVLNIPQYSAGGGITSGTVTGQLPYWNGTAWTPTSGTGLNWTDATSILTVGSLTVNSVSFPTRIWGGTTDSQLYGLSLLRSASTKGSSLMLTRPDIAGVGLQPDGTTPSPKGYQLTLGRSPFLTDIIIGDGTYTGGVSGDSGTGLSNAYIRFPNYLQGTLITDATGVIASLSHGIAGKFLMSNGPTGTPSWQAVSGTGLGDITGPSSSIDNRIARWDGTTGKILQDSGVLIDDSNNLSTAGTISSTYMTTGNLILGSYVTLYSTATSSVYAAIAKGGIIAMLSDITDSSMIYPTGSGIPIVSSGTSWGTTITNNSANWNTAYADRNKWDGGATGLTAATGRTSLGLGSAALSASTDFATSGHTHSIYLVNNANTSTAYTITASNFILSSDKRLKTCIKPIITEPVNIEYKEFEMKNKLGEKRYGVLAQELVLENPELVCGNEEDGYSVKYIDLLVKEIASLKYRIKKLEEDL